MSDVVSDTSPLNYLVQIGAIDLLPHLFGTVAVPEAVRDELADPRAPEMVRAWITSHPAWLHVAAMETERVSPDLARLHPGEREAILLAQRREASLVLLDEKAAREAAVRMGLRVTGLLGVLDEAAKRGLLDRKVTASRLQATSFRVSPRLLRWFADR